MVDNLHIAFFGTTQHAVPILESLVKNGHKIDLVITQPDEPAGRKLELTPPPIKLAAEKLGLKVVQPARLKDYEPPIKYDLAIVCFYGKIIPQRILDIPQYGNINVHPSLLPKYRGPAPAQGTILNNETVTGVSIIKLDKEMDHGPILEQKTLDIKPSETAFELSSRLTTLGAEMLNDIIPKYIKGEIELREQNHEAATFTKMMSREDGKIDFKNSAQEIFNKWRAYQPWPGIWMTTKIKDVELRIKLIEVKLLDEVSDREIGSFVALSKTKLGLIAGDKKIIEVVKLQLEGKNVITADAFINGYRIA